jgi:hypothetical protein
MKNNGMYYAQSIFLFVIVIVLITACSSETSTLEGRLVGRWSSTDQIYYTLDGSVDTTQAEVTLFYEFFEDGAFIRRHTVSYGDVVFEGKYTVTGNKIVFEVLNKEVPEEIQANMSHITQYENEFVLSANKLKLVTLPSEQFSKIETFYDKLE